MPAGRPSKYKPEYCGQAAQLCNLGATDDDLAKFFGVSVMTIRRWAQSHEEFCASLKTGKEAADDRVERSLYNRAVGYSFESEKVFQYQGEVIRAKTVEHVPPDTTAQIFWLKNRRRDEWRDRRDLDINNNPWQEILDLTGGTASDEDRDSDETVH